MTIQCSVRGCRSGSYSDKRQKIRAGLRQTTIFAVPRTATLLEKWSRALNQELSRRDKVCELHFANSDIKRSDDTLMPDGTIFSIPMQKYSLRKDAVPTGNQENKIPLNQENSTNHEVSQNEEKENEVYEEEELEEEEEEEEVIVYLSREKSNSEFENVKQEEMEFSPQNSMESLNIIENESTTETLQVDEKLSISNFANPSIIDHQYYFDEKKPGQYYYYNREVAACFAIPAINMEKKQTTIDSSLNDQTPDLNEGSNSGNEVITELTIKVIIDYLLKNPLPKSWSWLRCTKKDNGITFIQIHVITKKIRCSVQLYEDLSIIVHTADENISMEIEYDITSPESVLKILETVEKLKICNGSGVDKDGKQARASECTGVVTPNEEYKVSMQCDRCMACRKIRRILLSREKEPKVGIKAKYQRAKKELDLVKRKCRCLEEKLKLKNSRLKAITEMIKTVNKYNKILE